MTAIFQFTVDNEGICKVLFDIPGEKVNKLNREVMRQFRELLSTLKARKDIKVVLFTSDKIIAGADLNEFVAAFHSLETAKELVNGARETIFQLPHLPFPTIFLINGLCVGGGLEMALLCNYRVVADQPKTSLSFPETSIGIFPGWGGTQTAPRLIGLAKGTEMVVSGKALNAAQAYKAHLVDAIARPEFLEEKGKEFARMILTEEGKKKVLARRKNGGIIAFLLEKNPIGRAFLFSQFRKGILKKTKGHYPSPLIALDVIKKTFKLPIEQGLKIEGDAFDHLLETENTIPRYLVSMFFIQDKLKKNGGYTGELPEVRGVENAAVLGAGTMGGGISYLFSNAKIPVRMKDINWEMIGKGVNTIWEQVHKSIIRKKVKQGEAEIRFHDTSWTLDYSGFEKKDFVLEAIVENPELKERVYRELEEKIPKKAIIATNTSSLRVDELCSKMEHPERFIGMHFFNPAPVMPLVEIIKGPQTTDEVLAKTIDLAKKMGKVPLVVKDCHGFLVNRILITGSNEAFHLIDEGCSVEEIDRACIEFGLPMGLCEVIDLTGIDVAYHIAPIFHKAYGERMETPPIVKALYDAKCLGKKSGKGFYIYEGKSKKVNPLVTGKTKGNFEFDRIILAMINEASRCLEEQIVTEPGFVDIALVMGAGFPPFRGGVLRYADQLGIKTVYEKLKKLEERFPVRFKPTELIETLAKNNQTFYKD
ncbi:MAG: enoyl-CoA hydratase/isomerase family protein [Verrucomicrobia bacterium]|nr:enoyl-CoA hydratase/isomerase family protein [Verrucomicrobiota bacterium]